MAKVGITKTNQDNASFRSACQCRNLAEIQIKRQDSPIFRHGFAEDFAVGQTLEAVFAEMDRIVPLGAQPLADPDIHTRVHLKAHGRSGNVDFFFAQPGRVLDGLLNVFPLEGRVALQDFGGRGAVSDLTNDDRHRYAHPTDARAPPP